MSMYPKSSQYLFPPFLFFFLANPSLLSSLSHYYHAIPGPDRCLRGPGIAGGSPPQCHTSTALPSMEQVRTASGLSLDSLSGKYDHLWNGPL